VLITIYGVMNWERERDTIVDFKRDFTGVWKLRNPSKLWGFCEIKQVVSRVALIPRRRIIN